MSLRSQEVQIRLSGDGNPATLTPGLMYVTPCAQALLMPLWFRRERKIFVSQERLILVINFWSGLLEVLVE